MAQPVQRIDDYGPGDFSFIKDPVERELLCNIYKIIDNIPGAWKSLKKHGSKKFCSLGSQHCLRNMEFIAKQGWEDFVFLMR